MASHFTPGEQALVDQARAEVRDHITRIREHWRSGTCEWGGQDTEACISEVDKDVVALPDAWVKTLYMEALIMLVRQGVDGDGAAPGG